MSRGREELYRDQVPQLLESLSENARVESIRASNAIEGIEVDAGRVELLAREGGSHFRSRNEREFAGYRDALDELMRKPETRSPTVGFILHLHGRLYSHTRAAGGSLKLEDNYIRDTDEHGERQVVFTPPAWRDTPFMLKELEDRYREATEREVAHPLVLVSALILDLLAIHPVIDGNGRTARLLTTSELLRQGYGVPRYVSLEQLIFESKDSYYDTLYASQQGWHDGAHSIWPWTDYLTTVLLTAYVKFESRAADARGTGGMNKQARTRHHVENFAPATFRIADLRSALPGVSDPTLRLVLNQMREEGRVEVDGVGRSAVWRRRTQ